MGLGLFTSILIPAGDYMFKVNNRNIRTRCEIRSKLKKRHHGVVEATIIRYVKPFHTNTMEACKNRYSQVQSLQKITKETNQTSNDE